MGFVHLNLHTEYSINNGIGKIDKIVKRVKELGQDSVAITDDGTMYGVVEFLKTCIVNGIKPIIGAEVYVVNGSRLDNDASAFR